MDDATLLYAVEPIVQIGNNSAHIFGNEVWGELLYRGERFPQNNEEWKPWYRSLPQVLNHAEGNHPFTRITINVDSSQMLDPEIVECLYRLEGRPVALEWTECRCKDISLKEIIKVGKVFDAIRAETKFPLLLDDVGAGEDVFRRFCATKPDAVKIDGEIFHLARSNDRIADLIARKIEQYREMEILTVIEWIETETDLDLAIRLGADWGQGYLWSRSAPSANKQAVNF